MKETEEYLEVIDVDYENDQTATTEIILMDHMEKNETVEEQAVAAEETEPEETVTSDEMQRDTSFETYDREKSKVEQEKRRGFFSRLTRFIGKVAGTLIAIPFVVVGGTVGLGVVAMGFAVGIGAIGAGIAGVGASAFLLTGYPGLIGLLGMFIAMGLLAGGGLAICIVTLIWRQIKRLIKWMIRYKVRYREVE